MPAAQYQRRFRRVHDGMAPLNLLLFPWEFGMCGIVGVVSTSPVNQLIYDSLLLLQHRGQDAAGIATANGSTFHMHKANGLVRDVFRTRNMRGLPGTSGIGQEIGRAHV